MWDNTVLVFMGDNGGPTFEGHSNYPLRGGKLNFFEGGIRPASFVSSPLLPRSVVGTWYNGYAHEVDWVPTFLTLAGVPTPAGIDGIDFWPSLIEPANKDATLMATAPKTIGAPPPHRTEVLIADHILRVGDWKYVTGSGNETWIKALLRDCMLGTGGGWMDVPSDPKNNSNICPEDIYTRSPKKGKTTSDEIGCPVDNATVGHGHVVTSVVDLWLCSNPCTPDNPCLWNLATDPGEREEVSAENPQVVASMKSRLLELSASFKYNPPMMGSNDVFCQHVKERGGFLGPWIPSL